MSVGVCYGDSVDDRVRATAQCWFPTVVRRLSSWFVGLKHLLMDVLIEREPSRRPSRWGRLGVRDGTSAPSLTAASTVLPFQVQINAGELPNGGDIRHSTCHLDADD